MAIPHDYTALSGLTVIHTYGADFRTSGWLPDTVAQRLSQWYLSVLRVWCSYGPGALRLRPLMPGSATHMLAGSWPRLTAVGLAGAIAGIDRPPGGSDV